MTVKQIRAKARELGIARYSKLDKEGLVRAVQVAEGNQDCYRRIDGCGELDCCWRDDCQQAS